MMDNKADNFVGKRGKKGGATFPKYSLRQLLPSLKALVSKTHTNTISIEQFNAGVLNISSKSAAGKVKFSALKQFNLAVGDYSKLKATNLSSQISIAETDEKTKLLFQAFGNVKIFMDALHTFQNSTVDKTRIANYAQTTLKVHPDFKEEFSRVFIESAESAGVCTIDGSSVAFSAAKNVVESLEDNLSTEDKDEDADETEQSTSSKIDEKQTEMKIKSNQSQGSNINVSIDVNSSMDPEKLEKFLKLLKEYGAI